MNRGSAKGGKWLAEGPHCTWGSTRSSMNTQIPPEQTQCESDEAGRAATTVIPGAGFDSQQPWC